MKNNSKDCSDTKIKLNKHWDFASLFDTQNVD